MSQARHLLCILSEILTNALIYMNIDASPIVRTGALYDVLYGSASNAAILETSLVGPSI